jgi:putative peptidoglycan lipid II flippase
MVLVTQLAGIVQVNVALTADPSDASVAVLRTAWLVFMLPHSIITVSIATPYFTRMSASARDGRIRAVRGDLSTSLRTTGMLVTGAAAALAAAALPFAAFFANTDREVTGIAGVLLAYLPGLVPFSVLFLVQRVFYALGDTRTPFLLQLVQSGLFVIGALLALAAPSAWVAAGIALVTSVAGTAQSVAALLVLRGRLGGIDGRRVLRRFGTYALATIPAAAAGLGVLALLGGFTVDGFALSGRAPAVLAVGLVSLASVVVYVGGLAALRVPELRALLPSRRDPRS